MKHYRTKPHEVMAEQYTGDVSALHYEARKSVVNSITGGSCWIFTGLREVEVKVGDWIVVDGERAFVCTREDFPRYYEVFVPEGNPYETHGYTIEDTLEMDTGGPSHPYGEGLTEAMLVVGAKVLNESAGDYNHGVPGAKALVADIFKAMRDAKAAGG